MMPFALDMVINDCNVSLEFYMGSDGLCWDTMKVIALLSDHAAPEGKHWVIVNDLLSDADWLKIETKIYLNEDELFKQKESHDY
jgi:hypothetical protein